MLLNVHTLCIQSIWLLCLLIGYASRVFGYYAYYLDIGLHLTVYLLRVITCQLYKIFLLIG